MIVQNIRWRQCSYRNIFQKSNQQNVTLSVLTLHISLLIAYIRDTGSYMQCNIKSSDHIDYTISRYWSQIRRAYDIVAAIYRTISCTNARLARALLTYCSDGVCVWLMSLAMHTVRGSLCLTFPAVDLSCSALGAWGRVWGTAVAPVVG